MTVSDFTYRRIERTGFADEADRIRTMSTRYEQTYCDHCDAVTTHRDRLDHFGITGMACLRCVFERIGST